MKLEISNSFFEQIKRDYKGEPQMDPESARTFLPFVAAEELEKILIATKRPSSSFLDFMCVINRGINPFTDEEVSFSKVDLNRWKSIIAQFSKRK